MWRFSRFLNAVEAQILAIADEPEIAYAELHAPPVTLRVVGAKTSNRRRRSMTLAQARATAQADEDFQREMRRER